MSAGAAARGWTTTAMRMRTRVRCVRQLTTRAVRDRSTLLVRTHPIDESDLVKRARFDAHELTVRSSLVSPHAKAATLPWRQFIRDHPRAAWLDDYAFFLPNGFIGAGFDPTIAFPFPPGTTSSPHLPIDAWFERARTRPSFALPTILTELPTTAPSHHAAEDECARPLAAAPTSPSPSPLSSSSSSPLSSSHRPVHLELGSGSGDWLVERCRRHPHVDFVGVELNTSRVMHMLGNYLCSPTSSPATSVPPHNLRIVRSEVHFLFAHYFAPAQFDAVYVNFPDSWPKKQQFHRRLIQPHFVATLHRALRPAARVHLVTDHDGLHRWMHDAFLARSDLFSLVHAHTGLPADYGLSMYGRLWAARGLPLHYLEFQRVEGAAHRS